METGFVQDGYKGGPADGQPRVNRLSRYAELGLLKEMGLPYAGNAWRGIYVFNRLPIGSPVTYANQTGFDNTKAFWWIFNPFGSLYYLVMPDYIRAIVTTSPTNTTSIHYALALDDWYYRALFFGATQLSDPLPVASDKPAPYSIYPQISTGPMYGVSGAPSAGVRYIARGVVMTAAPPVGTEIIWAFNNPARIARSLGAAVGERIIIPCGPVVLGYAGLTGDNNEFALFCHLWLPGCTTPMQYEMDTGSFVVMGH